MEQRLSSKTAAKPQSMDAIKQRLVECTKNVAAALSRCMAMQIGNVTSDKDGFQNSIIHTEAINTIGMVLLICHEVTEEAITGKELPVVC